MQCSAPVRDSGVLPRPCVEHLAGVRMLQLANQQRQRWLLARLLPSFSRLLTDVRSSSSSPRPPQELPPAPELPGPAHFMVGYLVGTCGLSPAQALSASRCLRHLRSPAKPNAVLQLLKQTGLSDAHITRVVRVLPRVLVADPKKTLEPKIRALQEAGFSDPEIAQLISACPQTLHLRDVVSRIHFWRELLGSDEKVFKLAKTTFLIGSNLDGTVGPNLAFLRSLSMSDADICKLVLRSPRSLSCKLEIVKSMVKQLEDLGVSPSSRRFVEAMCTVCNVKKTSLESRAKLLRSFGWSEEELRYAFQRFPPVLRLSEKKLTAAMNFLVEEAGCKPSYVARRPALLAYNMEGRLIPRYKVLQFLKKKGHPGGDSDVFNAVKISDGQFVDRFVSPFCKDAPELLEMYPIASVSASSDAMTL